MFGLESECEEQCDMQQLTSCVDYLVAMARAGNCRETTRISYYNKPDSIWHHHRHVPTRISLHFIVGHRAIAIAIAITSLYEYYNIVDGAAAFTKTNKRNGNTL